MMTLSHRNTGLAALYSVAFTILALALAGSQVRAEPAPLHVFSAGSMRGALTAIAHEYEAASGQKIELTFGPAGLLREQIEKSGGADLYVSANMAHPERLAAEGKGTPPVVFARNRLCVTGRASLNLTSDTLLAKLLDPSVKIGTSTPGADPGGDYAWQFFAAAEKLHPGAQRALEAKAHQLVGGPDSPKIPPGENALHYFMAQNQADVFIGYCSSANKISDPAPPTDIPVTKVEVPPSLAFPIGYGLMVLSSDRDAEHQKAAYLFALYLMSPAAQKLLPAYGFLTGGGLWAP